MISQLSECLGVDVAVLLRSSEKRDKTLNIILLDDERIILEGGLSVLKETLPTAEISCFTEPDDAIRFVKENKVQIAFVDIEMGRVDICKELLKIEPNMNVIFLTAFSQYSLDAWKTGACGFIEKPLSADDIRWQIAHLRRPVGGVL